MDVSNNTALTNLQFNNNQLTSLNISGAASLNYIIGNDNKLPQSEIDNILARLVSNGLTNGTLRLHGTGNSYPSTAGFTSRDTLTGSNWTVWVNIPPVSGHLVASNTGYYPPSIDYSDAYILSEYDGAVNNLSSNNLQGALYAIDCTNLLILNCYNNQLTSLNVSGSAALDTLYCNQNQLTSLDLSTNTALTYLNCGTNQLTSLDVSNNTALIHLDCNSNPAITSGNWDTILHTLVQNELTGGYFNIYDTNHGGLDNPPSAAGLASGSILTSRDWRVHYDGD